MEGDDRAVACVTFHVVEYLFRAHPLTVIAGHEVPHDDPVMIAEGIVLSETHVAVWRAEQVGMYDFIYFLGICQIFGVGVFESTDVVESVVADAVIVNRVADLTIYVVRAGRMDRRALPEVEKLYQEGKLRNMSLILNGTVYKHGAYGYRYGYGYGYSYGYGYGYGQRKNK